MIHVSTPVGIKVEKKRERERQLLFNKWLLRHSTLPLSVMLFIAVLYTYAKLNWLEPGASIPHRFIYSSE